MASVQLISATEAARRLGVNVATVNRWAKSGELPAAAKAPGLRGANLFDVADVELLRSRREAEQ